MTCEQGVIVENMQNRDICSSSIFYVLFGGRSSDWIVCRLSWPKLRIGAVNHKCREPIPQYKIPH